ncbi:MAG TPA: hypothetical protein VFD70_19150 [Anaerolineae bacterium]|nr:hypothetical protein [Anaerolineae bacterium]
MANLVRRSWQAHVAEWVAKRGAGNLSEEFVAFFEKSFQMPLKLYPRDAWFGIHDNCISLTIGNMWLAAIASPPKCVYLIAERELNIKGFGSLPIRSTLKYVPLVFITAKPWDGIRKINRNKRAWELYARGCELILQSPISRNVITRNLHRKARLADMRLGEENDRECLKSLSLTVRPMG